MRDAAAEAAARLAAKEGVATGGGEGGVAPLTVNKGLDMYRLNLGHQELDRILKELEENCALVNSSAQAQGFEANENGVSAVLCAIATPLTSLFCTTSRVWSLSHHHLHLYHLLHHLMCTDRGCLDAD
jgi:hypothetical protein